MSLFASSSFSETCNHQQYEVFISFRGEDTRYTFASHLHQALHRRKIVTFIDDGHRRGHEISPALTNAIEKSKVAIVIFSKDYASSTWSLDELVKIIECKKGYGQTVIPVFYHVKPTDVRNQAGSYGKSLAKHLKKGIPLKTLLKWRIALTEASDLPGYDMDAVRDEALLTELIVDDIWKELRVTYKIDNKNLVGIESKMEIIKSLVNLGSGDVCVVGLWGLGGMGKTTLANAVFNKIRTQFEGSCFLRNIREESGKDVERLRQQLYFDISGGESGKIVDMDVRLNFLLSRKTVLIVFDDVTDVEQIINLVGDVDSCNRESRFILTTKNKQVLRNCGCKEEEIYKVNGLSAQEADQLFRRFAYKKECPLEDYMELSWKMVDYTRGSPLLLEVLGSSLSGKGKPEWESVIEKLERDPNQEIQSVLKVSFDGLDYEQKDVFLDVACFFKGKFREDIVKLYNDWNYNIEITLSTLIDKCLLSVDSYGRITMHDLLQELGWQIVREQAIENPGERSRLWHTDDIYQVLTRNEGTRAIKGISLDISKTRMIHLNKNSFNKMSELWFLNIHNSRISCSEDFQCASTKLRFLCWEYCPLKSLQSSFSLDNLVILEMKNSEIEQLWNGVQHLPYLKEIDLSYSQNLTAIPDLSLAPKLEEIDLSDCRNLTSLPPCGHMKSLWILDLQLCKKLVAIPELSCNIRELNLYGTGITCLPLSIGNLSQLPSLSHDHCHELGFVSKEFSNLKSIQSLSVSTASQAVTDSVCSHSLGLSNLTDLNLGFSAIVELPDTICHFFSLKKLNLESTDIVKLPENIIRLSNLEELFLDRCRKLQFLPKLPRSLKYLFAISCSSLQAVPYSLSILLTTTRKVSFSGCYMLDVDAFTTIIQDALLKIQRRFRECPAQAIREDEDRRVFLDQSYICYSGCEIPKIFEFQHLGSMICQELSHDMIGGKIVGLAFFVVYKSVRPKPIGEWLRINFHCKTTFENGECILLREREQLGMGCISADDSKVVVVGYTHTSDHHTFPSQYQSILLELEFSPVDYSCYEVEKCGFHLFCGPVSEEEWKGTSSSSSEEKELETSLMTLKIS